MLTVALTGGIASGKSVVADVFRRKGCAVDAADPLARGLMAPGGPAYDRIVGHFGRGILNPDRTIDRKALAEIVFRNPAERRFLDGVIHPLVFEQRKATIARLAREGRTKIYVAEAALTIEAGFHVFYDKVVVAYCPESVQVARLMDRDRLTREDALRRIAAQMPIEEKKKHADYVIDTSGTVEETIAQTECVHARLLEDCARKDKGQR